MDRATLIFQKIHCIFSSASISVSSLTANPCLLHIVNFEEHYSYLWMPGNNLNLGPKGNNPSNLDDFFKSLSQWFPLHSPLPYFLQQLNHQIGDHLNYLQTRYIFSANVYFLINFLFDLKMTLGQSFLEDFIFFWMTYPIGENRRFSSLHRKNSMKMKAKNIV